MLSSASRVISPLAKVPSVRPRLRTVNLSPTAQAWWTLWVMKITPKPRARAWATYFSTTEACFTPRAEVGSSRISTLAPSRPRARSRRTAARRPRACRRPGSGRARRSRDLGPPADCVMAVGQRAADGHMRGTPQQLRTQSDQAPPPADPRRARRRAGPARAGPRHRRRPIPPADLALPGLSRPVLARAQPLRAAPRRPALAGSPGGRPAPGAALLLRRARLPEADLRRAAARRRPPFRAPQRAPRRRPSP